MYAERRREKKGHSEQEKKERKKEKPKLLTAKHKEKREKEAHLCPRRVRLDVAHAQLVHLLDLEGDAAVLVVDEHRVGEHPVDDFQR